MKNIWDCISWPYRPALLLTLSDSSSLNPVSALLSTFVCCLPLTGALRPAALVAGVVVTVSEDEAEVSWALSAATCCSELRNRSLVLCCKVFWVSSCFLASNN